VRNYQLAVTQVMMTTPTAAMEVLLGLTPPHVVIAAEAGIYRLMCSHQWKPKSTKFCHARKTRAMQHTPILQTGTDRMILRYAYHKPFMVKFPEKCECKKGFKPGIKEELVSHTDRSKTNKGTGVGVYR
jgi:hypothetical protein